MAICLTCKSHFEEGQGKRGSKKLYCGLKCYPSYAKLQEGYYNKSKTCEYCKKEYKTYQYKSKYCSIDCANKGKGNKVISINHCVVCSKPFRVFANNMYGHCCSKKCTDKRYGELNPDAEHNKRARYRTKKNGNTIEEVSFKYICERDNWKCQICGKGVSKTKKYPHPLSPSLDHIKPISLNGSHSHDNTQLAHLRCNLSKGASVGYQLRLTG